MLINKMTALDLFCRCGGFSAGFIDSEIEVLAAFDNWDKKNQPEIFNYSELIYQALKKAKASRGNAKFFSLQPIWNTKGTSLARAKFLSPQHNKSQRI